jgi:N-dimethylarginine dimethylaminohydrolase
MTSANVRFLMCRPEHFGVAYAINPWMDPASWAQHSATLVESARREWTGLYRNLARLGAAIELVPPVQHQPDLVFTANAAVVLDRKVLLARFRHAERRGEEAHFEAAFRALRARGIVDSVTRLPDGLVLEGAGDCVWDDARQLFWTGYGQRSDRAATGPVGELFGVERVALELKDPRFYHLDTALCALARGEVMYVPDAFTPLSLAAIRERVAAEQRVEVEFADASRLATNAVSLGDAIMMSGGGERLKDELAGRGYQVIPTPLPSFLRSGGSAFCLTLRLDRHSRAGAVREDAPAAAAITTACA